MEKIVITFKEDVMAQNQKSVPQKEELVKLLYKYGSVENYEDAVSKLKAEYQTTIDNLNTQYKAIADQNLSSNEIKLVKLLRDILVLEGKDYLDRIALLEKTLTDVRIENQNRAKQIIAMFGEEQ